MILILIASKNKKNLNGISRNLKKKKKSKKKRKRQLYHKKQK